MEPDAKLVFFHTLAPSTEKKSCIPLPFSGQQRPNSREISLNGFPRLRCDGNVAVFLTFPGPPLSAQVGFPRFQNTSFFKLNLSDRGETFRIDAAGELINVADYEHDRSTLSDFSVSEKLVSIDFHQC